MSVWLVVGTIDMLLLLWFTRINHSFSEFKNKTLFPLQVLSFINS